MRHLAAVAACLMDAETSNLLVCDVQAAMALERCNPKSIHPLLVMLVLPATASLVFEDVDFMVDVSEFPDLMQAFQNPPFRMGIYPNANA